MRYENALEFYHKHARYPLMVGDDIEGDTIETLEEWKCHPYRAQIMEDATNFMKYLRTLKDTKHRWYYPSDHWRIGRCNRINVYTPIYQTLGVDDMDDFVAYFEKTLHGEARVGSIAVSTEIGEAILHQLKNAHFSHNVFCHNYLCYKSFVLKNNKLIGIRNWQYAGFYPPELEDIMRPYLDEHVA
jgi:hypothetical protein